MGDIVKTTELAIFKTVSGSILLRLNPCLSITDSIGLFDFDIRKWQTIDKNNDIWTKFILTILASNLKREMKGISFRMFPINIGRTCFSDDSFVKSPSQIILV